MNVISHPNKQIWVRATFDNFGKFSRAVTGTEVIYKLNVLQLHS